MIRHGTRTANDCYPPVISLFRAAPRRARKTSHCMQMLVFLLQRAGLLAGLVPTCWAYKRLFAAECGESLIWSLEEAALRCCHMACCVQTLHFSVKRNVVTTLV